MIRSIFLLCVLCFLSTSCFRNSSETWENFKTAGRYMGRGVDAFCGKDYESRMLTSDEEFIGPYDDEFVPLKDADLRTALAMSDSPLPQPKGIPGQKGIPPLSEFYPPPDIIASLFRSVHFDTDEHIVRDRSEIQALIQIASYLKKNPTVYLVVEGHTDERAAASYNMALGMRRANYVRSFLVKQGVDLNHIYTISHGKEQPLAQGHTAEDWKVNRRSEFRMYQK